MSCKKNTFNRIGCVGSGDPTSQPRPQRPAIRSEFLSPGRGPTHAQSRLCKARFKAGTEASQNQDERGNYQSFGHGPLW